MKELWVGPVGRVVQEPSVGRWWVWGSPRCGSWKGAVKRRRWTLRCGQPGVSKARKGPLQKGPSPACTGTSDVPAHTAWQNQQERKRQCFAVPTGSPMRTAWACGQGVEALAIVLAVQNVGL